MRIDWFNKLIFVATIAALIPLLVHIGFIFWQVIQDLWNFGF